MARFMTGGRYETWLSQEANPLRIRALHAQDPDRPQQEAANREDILADLLAKQRRKLKTFLGQVAKCTSHNMYATIVRHATSLQWIYNKIRQDYDIQQKGIHFLNIIDLKYDAQMKHLTAVEETLDQQHALGKTSDKSNALQASI